MALTDNLIAYWPLDESSDGSGAVAREDVHGSNDLTDNNTTPSGTGKINNGADFEDGNAETLSRASNSDLQTAGVSFTFALWVNAESIAAATEANGILLKNNEFGLDYMKPGLVTPFIQWRVDGGGGEVSRVQADAPINAWYFVVCWYDRDLDVIGISLNNGSPVTSAHTEDTVDFGNPFKIGDGRESAGQTFDGLIDEVGFWKRVLTSDERTALYNGGAGLAYPFASAGLVAKSLIVNQAVHRAAYH